MEKDILVILMVSFGLFAIVMFVLFFIYLKKYYNTKHLEDDYKKEIDRNDLDDDDIIDFPTVYQKEESNIPKLEDEVIMPNLNENLETEEPKIEEDLSDMEFVPIKKK